MLKEIAKIRKAHGLHGAVVIEFFDQSYVDGLGYLQGVMNSNGQISIDGKQFSIERIFGIVNNLCRIQFVGCDMNAVKDLCGKFIQVEYDGFDYDELIGCKVKDSSGKIIATISRIHNFGAGMICDTDKDMILFDDLDLKNLKNKIVYLK